jgi:hypothetical protein
LIQLELSDAQVEVGQAQTPDGESIKVIRIIAPVAFLLPLPEDSAKQIATALSAAGIQIAHAGDVPKLSHIDGSLLDNH